jgi:predicted permease
MLRDMDEELRAHLDMRIEKLRSIGMSQSAAEAEALRKFGDTEEFRDYAARRVARKSRWLRITDSLSGWWQDVRFARRQFGKAPAFTGIALLTLALGIGANTAIFSVVHRLLLSPLPYPNGNRIVIPMQEDPQWGRLGVRWPVVEAWQARGHSIETIAGASESWFDIAKDGWVNYVVTANITSNYMDVLGVKPVYGRGFTDDEAKSGANVAMISYAKWQRDFGGLPSVLGKTVAFDDRVLSIIGVTPPGMGIPMSSYSAPDVWIPVTLRGATGGRVFAKLREGSSADAASRELQSIVASLPTKGPNKPHVQALRVQDFLDGRVTRSIEVLFVAVGALLLIACANVANLLLARAWMRRREFSVRVALGAGRGRLARQVLTESLLLALGGGAAGVGIAWLTLEIIIALRPSTLASLADVRIEPTVLLWSLGVSVATGVLFGCAPALFAGAGKVGDVLRNESRATSGGVATRRLRAGLIVLEIAMSLVLLVGAGLLVRSFRQLQQMRLGFEPQGLVYFDVMLGPANRDRVPQTTAAIIQRIRAMRGVTDVAIGTMPGSGWHAGGLETEPDATGQSRQVDAFGTNLIEPGYFDVAKLAVVAGRVIDTTQLSAEWREGKRMFRSSEQVMVNRSLANRLWPNGGAIGGRVRATSGMMAPPGAGPEPYSTVVGIVDDVRLPGMIGDGNLLHLYSLHPPKMDAIPFVVRTSKPGEAMVPAIERAVKGDPTILVRPFLAGESYLRDALAPSKFAMALLTAFAIIAIVLAAVGLYGVIAYGVTQRTREIGVRVALGAEPKAIAGMVIGGAVRLAIVGVVLGGLGALAASRVLDSMLYGVSSTDPLTYVAIAALVGAIAVVAAYIPARRAVRVDPVRALRAD